MSKQGPLTGIRVVDMSTSYAGPTATMLLGDMGADVIKVERPATGDDARHWGPPFVNGESAWFLSANRNKRSIGIDIRVPEGRSVLRGLLETSHVFVQSLSPGKLERLRLDPASIHALSPRLVYCAVSGFGMTGPDQALPGYDLIAQARSGIMSVTGEAGGQPQRVSTALSDIATGFVAAFAIVTALRRQEQSGEGAVLDISLLDVDLALMAPRIAAFLAGEPEPQPSGATDSVIAIYQTFETQDVPIALAIGNESIWQRFCAAVGLDDLATDDRLASNAGRRAHREMVVGRISRTLRTQSREHWLGVLRAAGVPCGPVQFLAEVVNDPQVEARSALSEVRTPTGSILRTIADPVVLDGDRTPVRRDPPSLSRDAREILAELGYADTAVDELISADVVTDPAQGGEKPS